MTMPFGVYEFTVMTFDLLNAAQTFQRFMDETLGSGGWLFVYTTLTISWSHPRIAQQHIEHLRKVPTDYGLVVNMSKWMFRNNKIEFLGHIINERGILPPKSSVEAIQKEKTSNHC